MSGSTAGAGLEGRVSSAPTPGIALSSRITSLDLIRGVVMVLMAVDHVRVFAGVPAGGPTAGLFFTRWITHFCAPAFVFLAGTGAFLHGRKLGDKSALARFLVSRGVMLVLLELTLLRLAWTFNLDFANYNLAGVIWMLGWCMILLGGLVKMSTRAIGIFGLSVIFLQQLFFALRKVTPEVIEGAIGWLYQFLYFGGDVNLGANGPPVVILYVIIPWIGVMAAGYAFGSVMVREPAERRRLCLRIGLSAIALFLVLSGVASMLVGPEEGDATPALFRFLNQQKYPATQLFLLMTLGPMIALIPLAEKARGALANVLITFGRVPMFYYLLHIPVIHVAAIVVSVVREGSVNAWLFGNHPMNPPPVPDGYQWSLGLLYLVFFICVAILYWPCRWYARVKAERKDSWLQYL